MEKCRKRIAQIGLTAAFGLLAYATQARAASINVGSASGASGTQVQIPVTLSTMGAQVGGTQNHIGFDPTAPIVGCTIAPPFAGLSGTMLLPQGCTAGVNCQDLSAVIVRIPSLPIPDGTLLYTCNVNIAANAAVNSYPLPCTQASAANPSATPVPVECVSGQVQVLGTPTPTATPVPGGGGGGSGCEVVSGHHSGAGLFFLPAAALLLWRRRRASS